MTLEESSSRGPGFKPAVRKRRGAFVLVALAAMAAEFAVDMWINTEPNFPLTVWKVVEFVYPLWTSPVSLAAKFIDASLFWYELHLITAVFWGIAAASLLFAARSRLPWRKQEDLQPGP